MTPNAKPTGIRRKTALQCRLKLLRVSLGIGQSRLANDSGTTAPTISEVERGCDVMLSTALRIARQLGLPVESIWSLPVAKKRSRK